MSNLYAPRFLNNWRILLHQGASLLTDACCRLCGESCAEALCTGCSADLPWSLVTLTTGPGECRSTVATFDDAFPINQLIRQAKYRADAGAGRLLGQLVAGSVTLLRPIPELLIPIPMPWARLLWRGHDHAAVLAQSVARSSGIRFESRVLGRRGWQRPQASLDRDRRTRNVSRAFFVREVPSVSTVALIDDLSTTGATLSSAAQALQRAGIRTIHAVVVARHL